MYVTPGISLTFHRYGRMLMRDDCDVRGGNTIGWVGGLLVFSFWQYSHYFVLCSYNMNIYKIILKKHELRGRGFSRKSYL